MLAGGVEVDSSFVCHGEKLFGRVWVWLCLSYYVV